MLSEQIVRMFQQAERIEGQPPALKQSLSELNKQVENLAIRQACLRCNKAGHMLNIDPIEKSWIITQVKCDDYRVLPSHLNNFGIGFPCETKYIYICDEEAGGGADSHDDA